MQAKILCVYDEGAAVDTPLIGAQGLALLVDVDGQRTLFDTGMRPRYLAHNLDYLDIDPASIDVVAVSHGHRDHAGGLAGLLERIEGPVDVYAPESARGRKGLMRGSGLYVPAELAGKMVFKPVDDWLQLSDNLFMSPPLGGNGDEECFLILKTKKGPVVLSGCSHCGVQTVIGLVRDRFGSAPKAYIGGIHIEKKEKAKAQEASEAFQSSGCSDLHLNHCTSRDAITEMRVKLGLHGVENFYVGNTLEYEV